MILLIPVFSPSCKRSGLTRFTSGGDDPQPHDRAPDPPVGPVLYVLVSITKLPFERVARSVLIFILPLIFVLLLITYVPELVTFIRGLSLSDWDSR